MRVLALIMAAALPAAPGTVHAQAARTHPAVVNYAADNNWLCLPGRSDVCSTPLPTTALNPNGYGSVGLSTVAKDPPVDCFYVYPTVSRDSGLNSDLNAGPEENAAAATLYNAVVDGLLLELLSTGDLRRTTTALTLFSERCAHQIYK